MRRKLISESSMILFLLTLNPIVHAGKEELSTGVAKIDITPTESLYMGGYSTNMRDAPSDGTYGRIFIRSIVFDDGANKLVFIVSDLVGYQDYDGIREKVADATGIPFDHILLASTHNHAGPTIGGRNAASTWSSQFPDKVVKTVRNAINDLEPVTIGGGTGHSSIAMNRRKNMEDTVSYLTFDENNSSQSAGKFETDNPVLIHEMAGVYRLGMNPDGPVDDEVGIIRVDTMKGKPKAVIVNYACHGTSLGGRNRTISPEWMGHMIEYVEGEIPGVTGVFLQGAAGDINPRFVGGLDGAVDDLERTADLGYEIGEEVVRVFHEIRTDEPLNPKIQLANKEIECPLKYNHVMEDFRKTTTFVPTTVIKIDELTLVTFPGEMFHDIGKQIKANTRNRYSFLVGYCNGGFGYLPTQAAFSEGGYEPNSSRFAPVTEKIYVREVIKLLAELY